MSLLLIRQVVALNSTESAFQPTATATAASSSSSSGSSSSTGGDPHLGYVGLALSGLIILLLLYWMISACRQGKAHCDVGRIMC
ncbi:hypothetical protein FRB93_011581 [Tulasnella sp. JGI-2019a]|nr:hypothetical protein FRB93_011581 [Tulasnella sp. JGI-2019a]